MTPFWILDFRFSIGRLRSKALFVFAFCALLPALSTPTWAQQPGKIPRIGVLMGTSSYDTLRRGLRDLGYEHGKNIVVEYRFTEGQNERTPSLVAELVHLKVDALVVASLPGVRAAKKATKTIPIVVLLNAHPVEGGFVDRL